MAIKTASLLLAVLFFVGAFVGHASDDDVRCLRAIQSSFEDPSGRLNSSWIFTNSTPGFVCRFVGVFCWNIVENKILSIQLRGMRLKGNFPTGIKYCTSLTMLDLANNSLSGPIPSDISNLIPYATTLDLSHNFFSGEIPHTIANCRYLNLLKLDHNRLVGALPMELGLLLRIRDFDVSYNFLSGSVPDFARAVFSNDSYTNNNQLCGGPLNPCLTKHDNRSDKSFQHGFGIGYAFSFAVVFLCFSASSLLRRSVVKMRLFSRKRSSRSEDDQLLHFPTLKHKKEIPQLERLVNKMSFTELSKAVENFSNINVIGIGKMGTMYKATLPNGWFLAVKRLHDPQQFEGQFVSELLALSRIRHDNLIPLLGFCIEHSERLVVYKYMSNGNLYDWLHPGQGEAKFLRWPVRVKIAVGIARGLAWLHHKCIFRVVHRNICSKSVLLDGFFEPKISNFGATIMSNHGGAMFVYPDENDSGLLVNTGAWESEFVKKDVCDFGIVLVELITGMETKTRSSLASLHNALVEWTSHLSSSGWIMNDAIDSHLIGQGFDGEILQLLRIASDCVHPLPYERPTMLKVYERVSNLGYRYGIPCDYRMLLQPRRC